MRLACPIVAAVFLAACPVAFATPCGGFTDVDSANPAHAPFCENVEWMKNRGITLGCASHLYCPDGNVTRLQMAAFMNRLGNVTFQQGGNAFSAAGVIGTTDNQPLDVRVNGARVMRFEPNAVSPNVIGGSPANSVTAGARGATIAGGGEPGGGLYDLPVPNRVTDWYGTVGGGFGNLAGGDAGLGTAYGATVGGGDSNTASARGSTVAGGQNNTASGKWSTVAGGLANNAAGHESFAAGRLANANASGCFVWGDTSTANSVSCNERDRFVVRSLGGVFFFAGGNTQTSYTGVVLPPGATSWVALSDRRIKDNFAKSTRSGCSAGC